MEDNKRVETSDLKRRHFARIHERIQNKYDEMQKRLEKSKSVDEISSLKDEFSYKDNKCASIHDLSDLTDHDYDRRSLTQTVIHEEVLTENASYQEIHYEASVSELVEEFLIVEKEDLESEDTVDDNKFFGNDFSKTSIESLSEISGHSDGYATPTTTSPKISIRDRINLKISAAKERRRKTESTAKLKGTRQKVEKLVLSNTTKQEPKLNKKSKQATVTIALIEAKVLDVDAVEDKSQFLYCRFRLGTEKYKSKLNKSSGNLVKWQELFNLNMYEENMLEISLWDKDDNVGRTIIDLTEIEKEKTHQTRLKLECEVPMELFLLLSISGTTINTLVDIDDYQETQRRLSAVSKKFAWYHIKNDTGDVGWLSVIVYGAKGLSANDCCCILELGNERLQTDTAYKTNDPNWMKIFTFTVNDITSILEITVHDDKRSEDIGKLSIPLLNIRNRDKKWYVLKDVMQRDRAKGHNPRILLEMRVTWNLLRASMRVINPKETKYLETNEKLQRHTFTRNLSRAKAVLSWITGAFRVVKTCFEWESRRSNVIALSLWLLFCWFFKMWMLPLLILIPFVWYKPENVTKRKKYFKVKDSTEIEDSKNKDEKTTLRQKINSLQEMVQSVQNFLGKFASLGESIKNLFNFTVPFLSYLAIFMISVVAIVMFLIPVKYIFMTWGIHKFTRKILRPNRVPNNEILDLLSRVPDDDTLSAITELPLEEIFEEEEIK